jgi:hypothetical protein
MISIKAMSFFAFGVITTDTAEQPIVRHFALAASMRAAPIPEFRASRST